MLSFIYILQTYLWPYISLIERVYRYANDFDMAKQSVYPTRYRIKNKLARKLNYIYIILLNLLLNGFKQ